jgi:hypothetical protein
MTKIDYKRQAHNYYRNNEFYMAYDSAWKLPFKDFVKWFTDMSNKRRKRKPQFFYDSFFYDSFLVTQPILWLNECYALIVWKYYLETQEKMLVDFELYVAHNNPSLFIIGYKQKRTYLDTDRLNLIEKNDFPKVIKEELEIWTELNNTLDKSKNEIENLFEELTISSYDFLMSVVASFEAFVFQNPNDKIRWHFAGETLSLLIAIVQNKYDLSNVKVDEESLLKSYHKSVHVQFTHKLFDKAYHHILLLDGINRYSFEPELKIYIKKDRSIQFQESKAFNKQWEKDELRYAINEMLYYGFGEMLFDELKKNNIKFINGNNNESNQLGNTRQLAIKQVVYDLGINDEDLKNNNLPSLDVIISFLHGLAWRKLETTEKPLHEKNHNGLKDYSNRVVELVQNKKVIEFLFITKVDQLYEAVLGAGLKCDKKEFKELIKVFSYSGKNITLNSLYQKINLWQKPFIKVGEYIISPISILTSFTGLYTISESILRNFIPREGRRIEETLKEHYNDELWETYTLSENQEYGDVDVVMEDDSNIILLQLKRTTQKVNVVELNNQYAQDLKAIEQLTESKKNIKSNKKIHLWYVTTAFEKVYNREKDVLKVSYQDLLNLKRLLNKEKTLKFKSLSHFIEYIEADMFYNNGTTFGK